MNAMQTLEFWATIVGATLGLLWLGYLFFFPMFSFSINISKILLVVIIFLIFYRVYLGNKHGGKRRTRRNRRKKKKIVNLFIILILVILILLNLSSLLNLLSIRTHDVINDITPTSATSEIDPRCEESIIDILGTDFSMIIYKKGYGGTLDYSTPELVRLDPNTYKATDTYTRYYNIFGDPLYFKSEVYWGDKVGEHKDWQYGSIEYVDEITASGVTNSEGIILGDNYIKFRLKIEDISKYYEGNTNSKYIRPIVYTGQNSYVQNILSIPIEEALDIIECKFVN